MEKFKLNTESDGLESYVYLRTKDIVYVSLKQASNGIVQPYILLRSGSNTLNLYLDSTEVERLTEICENL